MLSWCCYHCRMLDQGKFLVCSFTWPPSSVQYSKHRNKSVPQLLLLTWYALNELFEHSLESTPYLPPLNSHTFMSFSPPFSNSETCASPLLSDNVETCSCLLSSLLKARKRISDTLTHVTGVSGAWRWWRHTSQRHGPVIKKSTPKCYGDLESQSESGCVWSVLGFNQR